MSTHRKVTRVAGLLVVASFVFAACSSRALDGPVGRPRRPAAAPPRHRPRPARPQRLRAARPTMDALIAAAKAEGALTTIALPHDWCNYGEVIDSVQRPSTGSRSTSSTRWRRLGGRDRGHQGQQGQPRPAGTRTSSTSACPSARRRHRRTSSSRTRSRPGTRSRIAPRTPTASWYGDYYGVLSFETNTEAVHQRPEGLGRPAQARVQEPGRPRRRPDDASNQAIQAVYASALANGGSPRQRRAGPRLLEADRQDAGNFVPVIANAGDDRLGCDADRARVDLQRPRQPGSGASGNPHIDVDVPATGRFGGVYVQAISKYAPHPNAAKLWMEYLYSDEGQNALAEGLLRPDPLRGHGGQRARVDAGRPEAKLPGQHGRRLPDPRRSSRSATDVITTGWDDRRRRRRSTPRRLRAEPTATATVTATTDPGRATRRALGGVDSLDAGSASCRSSSSPSCSC